MLRYPTGLLALVTPLGALVHLGCGAASAAALLDATQEVAIPGRQRRGQRPVEDADDQHVHEYQGWIQNQRRR
jgi:hypothetical protein